MIVIEARDANDAFLTLARRITALDSPDVRTVSPRGADTLEIGPVSVVMEPGGPIVTVPGRKLNPYFMAAEALWILGGCDSTDLLTPYMPSIAKYYDEGHTFGAYGPRIKEQICGAAARLRDDLTTRQAVITTWRPEVYVTSTRDVPCTVMFHFMARDGKLDMVTYMRSNDLWRGFTYDVFNFRMVWELLLEISGLELELGRHTHIVGSMHVYTSDFYSIHRMLLEPSVSLSIFGELDSPSPGGHFAQYDVPERIGGIFARLTTTDNPLDFDVTKYADTGGPSRRVRELLSVCRWKRLRDKYGDGLESVVGATGVKQREQIYLPLPWRKMVEDFHGDN